MTASNEILERMLERLRVTRCTTEPCSSCTRHSRARNAFPGRRPSRWARCVLARSGRSAGDTAESLTRYVTPFDSLTRPARLRRHAQADQGERIH